MKNALLLILTCSLALCVSCSKKNNQKSISAQTSIDVNAIKTDSELTTKLGKPDEIQNSTISNGAIIKKYGTNSFQIENGKVTATFRDPIGEESKLQYWFHFWGNESVVRIKSSDGLEIVKTRKSQEEVAFDKSLNKVVRIIRVNKL